MMIKKKNIVLASVLTMTLMAGSSAMAFASVGTDTVNIANSTTNAKHATAPVVPATTVVTPQAVTTPVAVAVKLTDAQRTIIKQMSIDNQKIALATLVGTGVFTQAEADAIIAACAVKPAPDVKNVDIYRNLTDVQIKALRAEMLRLNTISINQLVVNATITQAQADKLLGIALVVIDDEDKDKGTCSDDDSDKNATDKIVTDKIHGYDFPKTQGHDSNKMHGHDFEKNNNSDMSMKNIDTEDDDEDDDDDDNDSDED